jgi:hypothetical protein
MRGVTADPNDEAGRIVFDDWGRKIDVLALEGRRARPPSAPSCNSFSRIRSARSIRA